MTTSDPVGDKNGTPWPPDWRAPLKVRLAATFGRWYFAGVCRCGRLIRWRDPDQCPECGR